MCLRPNRFIALALIVACGFALGCSGSRQCRDANSAADRIRAEPSEVDAQTQPVSVLVALRSRVIESALHGAAAELSDEIQAALGDFPSSLQPEISVRFFEVELGGDSGTPTLSFVLQVSAHVHLSTPIGRLSAGADASATVRAALEVRHQSGSSSIHLDSEASDITEIAARANGLAGSRAIAAHVEGRLNSMVRNSALPELLARPRLLTLQPIRIDAFSADLAIRELRVIGAGDGLLVGAALGFDDAEALPVRAPRLDDDINVRIADGTALALGQRVLSRNNSDAATVQLRALTASDDGSLLAEASAHRGRSPCGQGTVRGRVFATVVSGRPHVRVTEWELVESSRPDWLTRRAMPEAEEIERMLLTSLALAIAPRPVSLPILNATVHTERITIGDGTIDATARVEVLR